MKQEVKDFHDDCIDACCQCPRCLPLNIADSGDFKTPYDVIKYWTDENTYGGNILMGRGYKEKLSDKSKEILKRVDKELEKAYRNIFK